MQAQNSSATDKKWSVWPCDFTMNQVRTADPSQKNSVPELALHVLYENFKTELQKNVSQITTQAFLQIPHNSLMSTN